jgi:hypothetical protein
MTFDTGLILNPAFNSSLACGKPSTDSGIHSKTSWRRIDEGMKYLDYPPKPRGFRVSKAQKTVSARQLVRASDASSRLLYRVG